MENIILFLNILFEGIKTILNKFFSYLLQVIKKIPFFEKIFIFFNFSLLVLLLQKWLWYKIEFDKSFIMNHSIYTDDLLIFFIFIFLIGFSSLIMIFSIMQKMNILNKKKSIEFYQINDKIQKDEEKLKNKEKIEIKLIIIFRIIPLLVITIFYFMNFISPERIAPTNEAVFSLQFFLFGINLILCWMTGILGIKYYAQYL